MKYLKLGLLLLLCFNKAFSQQNALQNLTNFLDGFWSSQNLGAPKQFIACFDENSAITFFQWLGSIYKETFGIVEGADTSLDSDETDMNTEYKLVLSNLECGVQTPDFSQILPAFNMPSQFNNLTQLTQIYALYSLAYPEVLSTGIAESYLYISQDNSYNLAGQSFGVYLSKLNIGYQVNSEAIIGNQVLSFLNGLFMNLELKSPYLFAECVIPQENPNLENFLYFYGNWSELISVNATPTNAQSITKSFFQGAGQNIFEQLSPALFQCFEAVPAYFIFKSRVGFNLNPLDPGFFNTLNSYISNKIGATNYITYMTSIYQTWKEQNYFMSGVTLADFFKNDLSTGSEKFLRKSKRLEFESGF